VVHITCFFRLRVRRPESRFSSCTGKALLRTEMADLSGTHQIGCHFPPLRSSSGADGVNRVSYQDRNAGRDYDD
jgi:hypothetical protein